MKFENINFGYTKGDDIFKNLSFEIMAPLNGQGHVVALMGASGVGKSTLFKLILKTEEPRSGRISFQQANPVIAYLPQEPVLFEHLTPKQNARYFETSSFYKKKFNENLFQELIHSLNIKDVLGNARSVLELSGGQRQRLSLLRALSIHPDILLLDEPTTGIDAEVKLQFLQKLREIIAQYNLLVIYITHNKLETELIADEVIYLSKNSASTILFQDNLVDFSQRPPLLEALKVFSYPRPNILKVKVDNGEIFPTLESEGDNVSYISLGEDNISFSDHGLKYSVIANNAINSIIKFEQTGQTINLTTKKLTGNSNQNIILNGAFNLYDVNGLYKKTIII